MDIPNYPTKAVRYEPQIVMALDIPTDVGLSMIAICLLLATHILLTILVSSTLLGY